MHCIIYNYYIGSLGLVKTTKHSSLSLYFNIRLNHRLYILIDSILFIRLKKT